MSSEKKDEHLGCDAVRSHHTRRKAGRPRRLLAGQSGIELVIDRIDGASMGFGALAEVGDDLGILGGDIELLGRVVIELIEEGGIVLDDRVGSVLGLGQKMGLERAMANSKEP